MILANLRTLADKVPGKLVVRVPIVPGCTDDHVNLQAMGYFLRSIGIVKIELMPYHALGVDKYACFGRKYRLDPNQSLTADAIEEAARVFSLNGIGCGIAGE